MPYLNSFQNTSFFSKRLITLSKKFDPSIPDMGLVGSLAIKPLTLLIVSNVVYLTCLFLHLGVLCGCANVESPTHLCTHCSFARQFWDLILEVFGWSTVFKNIFYILNSLMVGHLFFCCKKVIWLAILWASFWAL